MQKFNSEEKCWPSSHKPQDCGRKWPEPPGLDELPESPVNSENWKPFSLTFVCGATKESKMTILPTIYEQFLYKSVFSKHLCAHFFEKLNWHKSYL